MELIVISVLLYFSVIIYSEIRTFLLRKNPDYIKRKQEEEIRIRDLLKEREKEEKRKIKEQERIDEEIRLQIAFNGWMSEVYDFPTESFQLIKKEFDNLNKKGPWKSSLFNHDVKKFINSQNISLYLKASHEIEDIKYRFSPQGSRESQVIIDTLLDEGPKAAERKMKIFKKYRDS